MRHIYDVCIIGSGVAGTFAALRLANKDIKTLVIELGRPPAKRRRFCEGFLGCVPSGDGKIYTDLAPISDLVDKRKINSASKWFFDFIEGVNKSKLIKGKMPNVATQKKIKEHKFDIMVRDYYQWYPESIHQLSKVIAEKLDDSKNTTLSFDNEVYGISKNKDKTFTVNCAEDTYLCKKVILATGRSGWRFVNKLYKELGILVSDDIAKFGIRAEISGQYLQEWNSSNCTLTRPDLMVGPLSWNGSVIQEDHGDNDSPLTISAFRSNENRWESEKVSFSIIGTREFIGKGTEQNERLAKLSHLLSGDRVGRSKVRLFMKDATDLNMIPEFNWLKDVINELTLLVPNLIQRGSFHFPDIITNLSKINIGNNLESEIDGLFICGENTGVISDITNSAISGIVAADNVAK